MKPIPHANRKFTIFQSYIILLSSIKMCIIIVRIDWFIPLEVIIIFILEKVFFLMGNYQRHFLLGEVFRLHAAYTIS